MKSYILALDQGTTSSRAILFDGARPMAAAQKEFTQIYPKAGWVEHDAEEIYNSQVEVMNRVLRENNIPASAIAAIMSIPPACFSQCSSKPAPWQICQGPLQCAPDMVMIGIAV